MSNLKQLTSGRDSIRQKGPHAPAPGTNAGGWRGPWRRGRTSRRGPRTRAPAQKPESVAGGGGSDVGGNAPGVGIVAVVWYFASFRNERWIKSIHL